MFFDLNPTETIVTYGALKRAQNDSSISSFDKSIANIVMNKLKERQTCNKCGKTIVHNTSVEISGVAPYGSEFDGGFYNIVLCPECLDELIKSCTIIPVE